MEYETSALIREAAEAAAEKTVRETLLKLGIDTGDPLAMQRRMVMLEEVSTLLQDPKFEADLVALRQLAATLRKVRTHGLLTVVGILAAGLVAAVWVAIKSKAG